MPTRVRRLGKRYHKLPMAKLVSFRFGLYERQKMFLDEYSARLGACRSAILRESLDILIERWSSDPKFQPKIGNSDRDFFGDLISGLTEEREKEIDAEMEAFEKEIKESNRI